jgi:hypothetical protein
VAPKGVTQVTTPTITPEIRDAVHKLECQEQGHDLTFGNMLRAGTVPDNPNRQRVLGPPGQLPHVVCARCGAVWMLADEDGTESYSYAAAHQKFKDKLKDAKDADPKPPKP